MGTVTPLVAAGRSVGIANYTIEKFAIGGGNPIGHCTFDGAGTRMVPHQSVRSPRRVHCLAVRPDARSCIASVLQERAGAARR